MITCGSSRPIILGLLLLSEGGTLGLALDNRKCPTDHFPFSLLSVCGPSSTYMMMGSSILATKINSMRIKKTFSRNDRACGVVVGSVLAFCSEIGLAWVRLLTNSSEQRPTTMP